VKNFSRDLSLDKEEQIKFWKSPGSGLRCWTGLASGGDLCTVVL